MVSDEQFFEYIKEAEKKIIAESGGAAEYFVLVRRLKHFLRRSLPANNTSFLQMFAMRLKLLLNCVISITHFVMACFRVRDRPIVLAPASHRRLYGKTWVSKHADSLNILEQDAILFDVGLPNGVKALWKSKNYSLLVRLLTKLLPSSQENVLRVDAFLDLLAPHSDGLELKRDSKHWKLLRHTLLEYEKYKFLYGFFFSLLKPSRIICVAYYGEVDILAQVAVGRERKLEVVDYQHGIQNDGHYMYNGWSHYMYIPVTVPNSYYVWDKVAQRRIDRAFACHQKTRIVGNLWMKAVSKEARTTNQDSRKVLIALQAYPDYFPDFLWEMISRAPGMLWVFREHPNFLLTPEQKQNVLAKGNNILFESLDVPIEESLLDSGLCITGFSTVALDAYYLGKPAVFTHIKAKNHLSPYLDFKDIFYAGSCSEMLIVLNALNWPTGKTNEVK